MANGLKYCCQLVAQSSSASRVWVARTGSWRYRANNSAMRASTRPTTASARSGGWASPSSRSSKKPLTAAPSAVGGLCSTPLPLSTASRSPAASSSTAGQAKVIFSHCRPVPVDGDVMESLRGGGRVGHAPHGAATARPAYPKSGRRASLSSSARHRRSANRFREFAD